LQCVHREFFHESIIEGILKIDPHLPKLLSNINWLPFLGHSLGIKAPRSQIGLEGPSLGLDLESCTDNFFAIAFKLEARQLLKLS